MSILRRLTLILALMTCTACLYAGNPTMLRELTVSGRRPMKEIGLQKSVLDSAALKDNIALSMADVLAFNSSIFVKSYGRATLSTVSFRGTSPSHTQVTWNGMRINSPMLGMTDFSTIPAYFIDKATLLHGTSSVNEAGGGLGGVVSLGTAAQYAPGFSAQYVQGIGSFGTYDEFARATYGSEHWNASTRVSLSSSDNDYTYTNRDKKENIYDDSHNIVGQYYPRERNRSGAFRDFHVLQEVYYTTGRGDRAGLNLWYVDSDRELPMLTTDYGDETDFENRQREQTLRAVMSWNRYRNTWSGSLRAGYIHTWMAYDYRREISPGNWAQMTRSRNKVNTYYAQANADYYPSPKWYFSGNISVHQHFVRSIDRNISTQDGNTTNLGYDKARVELSAAATARWQPVDRLGLSLVLRQEVFGDRASAPIPAFFVDGLISKDGNVTVKASVSRNHKFPTLNDLYFMPGGNPDLRNEQGWTYDVGATFSIGRDGVYTLDGGVTWFDSYITDWIMWLPTVKGFFSPRNVKDVHAYGVELKVSLGLQPAKDWLINIDGSGSWTPSVNRGPVMTEGDRSVGKQLPYVPRWSASVNGRLAWRSWGFSYKWCYYSERFTQSSNDNTLTGRLPQYFMSNVSLEKNLSIPLGDKVRRPLGLHLKAVVNNLFDEDYLSVLARPMPGINFEFFVGLTF